MQYEKLSPELLIALEDQDEGEHWTLVQQAQSLDSR